MKAPRLGTSRMRIDVPGDYVLARDLCSYGYFLLEPNHWDPDTSTYSTTLDLGGVATTVRVKQESGRRAGGRGVVLRWDGQVFAPGAPLTVRGDRTLAPAQRAIVRRQLTRILRLDEPEAMIAAFHAADPRFVESGRGRLMRSASLFEDVLKTVTSCNVTWPSTVNMNRKLCRVLGRKSPSGGYAFPTARRLAATRPATLRARCSVGYRDARIVELARLFVRSPTRGGIDTSWIEDPATPDETLYRSLIDLPGIGPYAAANIMQLLGRYGRLPLDTESVRHGRTILGFKGTSAQVMKRVHAHFDPLGGHKFRSYWFELWEYYERKRGRSWTWQRETTGKTFTAALLD